jgi:ribosome-binding ATPase YchF (GTP1/OBG family)
VEVVRRVGEWMEEGRRASAMPMTDEERALIYDLHLITMKPVLYVANVDEADAGRELPELDGQRPLPICAKVEAELAELAPGEAAEYLEALGLHEPGLHAFVRAAYRVLGLQSFFTAGPMEARAWTVRIGAKAPEAAGVIHSDFEKGFIKAEVIAYADYDALGSEAAAKTAGKLRIEGREYVMADGDVVHFRFNV